MPWPAEELLAVHGDGALAEQRLAFRLLIPRGALPQRSRRLDGLSFSFGAEIGHVLLASGDFAGLERGDIVLLEASTSRLVEDGLDGEARFGARGFGAGPGFRARWLDGGARAELLEFHTIAAEAAKEVAMANAATGEALLPDLPVRLRVEMGRVQMTLAELSALGVGAIVELHRDPKEPVGLWVEDRKIGAGELVSVDGQLGVRITELG
ncbi:MAG: type III secretion system cytoplasmic ring protein SctQ [Candidatus Eisenbacteria bacterium]